ncbi:hypothetical protein ACFHW2_11490 [Actinomadura sp. LOL_016]|uniref:hypothetical protein n=1 Tax=unclassified Actinomadura TaxID=2626254 RepID=UPI003A7FE1BB
MKGARSHGGAAAAGGAWGVYCTACSKRLQDYTPRCVVHPDERPPLVLRAAPTSEQIKLITYDRRTRRTEERAARLLADGADKLADRLTNDVRIRSMEIRDGMSLDLEPSREMAAMWVGAARGMLGDAPNYTETPIEVPTDDDPKVTMEVKLAGEIERYAFTLQRVGKLTPHQARGQAEARADAAERRALEVERENERLRQEVARLRDR